MNGILWIVRKDLMRFVTDRHGALLTLLAPVVLASMLALLFSPELEPRAIRIVVVDQDGSPVVRDLIMALDETDTLDVQLLNEPAARSELARGHAAVALILPQGTAASLHPTAVLAGESRHLPLLFDPSRASEAEMVRGVLIEVWMATLTRAAQSPHPNHYERATNAPRPPPAGVTQLANLTSSATAVDSSGVPALASALTASPASLPVMTLQPPVYFDKQSVSARSKDGDTFSIHAHAFAGMLCMFLLFMAQDMAKYLIVERREGTLTRIRLSLVEPWQILFGAGVSTGLIALLISAIVYGVGALLFNIPIAASWPGFLAVIVGQAVFVSGFALFLAGVGRTERQLVNTGTFLILLISFAGGAWIPSFLMPEWLRAFAPLIPTHWSTEGLAAMTWRGLPWVEGLLPAMVLAGFGLLCAGLGAVAFRWED